MDWDACTMNPVRSCLSSQITYSGLTHGWPMIGGMLIGEFQNTLPKLRAMRARTLTVNVLALL